MSCRSTFAQRTADVALQILEDSYESIGNLHDLASVLRKIVFMHGAVFDRLCSPTNLAQAFRECDQVG